MTTPEEANTKIQPSQFYMTADASEGYFQIKLEAESQQYTVFMTPWGRYKFLRAPMGLNASGDEYCYRGDMAIEGLENCVKIVDDVCLWSQTIEEHEIQVRAFLDRCRANCITLNPNKFKVAEQRVKFCGYYHSKEGIDASDDLIDGITAFPTPSDIHQLRGFLGMVRQLNSFSPQISATCEPLRGLLKKDTPFIWTPDHDAALTATKELLQSPPTRTQFDLSLPTVLMTDASRLKGLGYALLQKHDDKLCLVRCGSRHITETEARYAMIELEALGAAWAMLKLRIYLHGLPEFELVIDHRPLVPILNSYTLDAIENPRLQRIVEKMTPYVFHTTWKKGSDHVIADTLSRNPVSYPDEECDLLGEAELEVHQVVIRANEVLQDSTRGEEVRSDQDPILERVRTAAKTDPHYQALVDTILSGFPNNKGDLHPQVKPYNAHRDELSLDNGLVLCGQRVIIPQTMRSEVLKTLHASHQGFQRTKLRARQAVFWPGINNEIRNVCQSCEQCQRYQPSLQQEPMKSDPPPQRPFESTSADLFYYAGKEYIVYADRASGWMCVSPFATTPTSNMVVRVLRKHFADLGTPVHLTSDGGPQFASLETNKFLKRWGVNHVSSSPHYPQSNGHAESSVKAAKALIKKTTKNGHMDTDEFYSGLLELRNTPRTEDGRSPAQILFGHPIRSNVPIHHTAFSSEWQVADQTAIQRGLQYRRQMQYQYDKHSRILTKFKVGQEVLIQNPTNKMWDTPGTVVAIGATGRDYRIKNDAGKSYWRNRRFLRRLYRIRQPDLVNCPQNDDFTEQSTLLPKSQQNNQVPEQLVNSELRRSGRIRRPREMLDL